MQDQNDTNQFKINYIVLYVGLQIILVILVVTHLVFYRYFNEMNLQLKDNIILILLSLFIGLVLSGVINIILLIYNSGNYYVKNLSQQITASWSEFMFPAFSPSESKQLSALVSSFVLWLMMDFINYQFYQDLQHNNVGFLQKQKIFLQMYMVEHYNLFISSLLLFICFCTSSLADFINLFFLVVSGSTSSVSNTKKILETFSLVFIISIIILYVFICYKQYKLNGKSTFLGYSQFLIGLFAIPGAFSIQIIKQAFTGILPCPLQNTGQAFITQFITPLTAALSFIVAFPYINPKFSQDPDIDMEGIQDNIISDLIVSAKMSLGAQNPHYSQKLSFTLKEIKLLRKAKCYIKQVDQKLLVSFSAPKQIKPFTFVNIFLAGFDWIKHTFSIQKTVKFGDNQISMFPNYAIKNGQIVYEILQQYHLLDGKVLISGHHFGAITAIYFQFLLSNAELYVFNAPFLISRQFYQKHVQIGIQTTKKLRISSILNQSGRWGEKCFFLDDNEFPTKVLSGAGSLNNVIWKFKALQDQALQ